MILPRPQQAYGKKTPDIYRHIGPEERVGFDEPFLVDLANDLAESKSVADQHPDVVKKLTALADAMKEDIGHGETIGKNTRFFDPKPEKMMFPLTR